MNRESNRRLDGSSIRTVIASILLALVACHAVGKLTAQEPATAGKTQFGQFAPSTDAERELEKMLRGKDEDIDLALANWLIVADIPQFTNMTREAYFKILDRMVEQVRQDMKRRENVARSKGKNPNSPDTRCAIFCGSVMKLGFDYAKQFTKNLTPAEADLLYGDANNVFLAGLLRSKRGSCVSMPLIYLVIGQRLKMPVYLVFVGDHYFIRWEEPGFRLNIETTVVDKLTVTEDDSAYTDWLQPGKPGGCQLRNLTNREVIGNFFYIRSSHFATQGTQYKTQQCLDLSAAWHLVPDDPYIAEVHQKIFDFYKIKPEHTAIEIRIKPKG